MIQSFVFMGIPRCVAIRRIKRKARNRQITSLAVRKSDPWRP
jgi:hypothetical protein